MKTLPLHWKILIALVLALIAGILTEPDTRLLGLPLLAVYDFLGSLFLRALNMIIVPLIMASIITGIASLGSGANLGRMGAKTMAYYMTTSLLAILMGLLWVNLLAPGLIDGEAAGERMNLQADPAQLEAAVSVVAGSGAADIIGIFLRMVPTNVVGAAGSGDMLGLIFFSLVFGFFMTQIPERHGATLLAFWQAVGETMMKITMWIMRFAPIGVFGLVAETVTTTGFGAFRPVLTFFFTVLLALGLHTFLTLPLLLKLLGRVNPLKHYRAMAPALLTAFSSASSSATLPLTMECAEQRAGISERTTSFVLPLGATINMDGTALYECVAALFLAQAYGLELTVGTQFTVVLIALLTSIGVAGIPAASLVAITVILTAIGLPVEALGLLLVTDRILDMGRTAVNVLSDTCGAAVIAHSEGEALPLLRGGDQPLARG